MPEIPGRRKGNGNRASLFLLLVTLCLPMIWLWPRFTNPSFSLIDDAESLCEFQAMKADFGNWWETRGFHGEEKEGRIRPVYWLIRFFLYYLPFGMNPLAWNAVHYLNLAAALFALFALLRGLSGSGGLAFAGCLAWIFSPCTIENYSRLATQEVWQVLGLGFSALVIYRLLAEKRAGPRAGRMGLLIALVFLLYFVKEPSVVILPFSLIVFAGACAFRKRRLEWGIFFAANLIFFVMQRTLAPQISGYTRSFHPSVGLVAENLQRYTFALQWHDLIFFLAITYAVRVVNLVRVRKRKVSELVPECWQFCFLALAAGFFSIILLWGDPVQRYLLVTEFLLVPFAVLEAKAVFLFLKDFGGKRGGRALSRTLGLSFGVLLALLAFFSRNELWLHLRYIYLKADEVTAVEALKWLSKNAKPNARVLLFTVENELLLSSARFTQNFFGRPDIVFYTFSPFAEEHRKEGYGIVPLKQGDWPAVLNRVDYIFWEHQGARRYKIDIFHSGLMNGISPAFRQQRMTLLFRHVGTYLNPFFPEGTEIWAVKPAE